MNDKYSASITHVWLTYATNKKTQNVYIFCFHGNGTTWLSEILQNTAISKQIILLLQTKYAYYIHILASPCMFEKTQTKEIMQLFKYSLPWQPSHQIVSDFTKKSIFTEKYLP